MNVITVWMEKAMILVYHITEVSFNWRLKMETTLSGRGSVIWRPEVVPLEFRSDILIQFPAKTMTKTA